MLTGVYTESETTIASIWATVRELFLAANYDDVMMDGIARPFGVTKAAL